MDTVQMNWEIKLLSHLTMALTCYLASPDGTFNKKTVGLGTCAV